VLKLFDRPNTNEIIHTFTFQIRRIFCYKNALQKWEYEQEDGGEKFYYFAWHWI